MQGVAELLAAILGGGGLVVAGGSWWLWRRVLRANRVVPSRACPVPLGWRWSPRRAALLHRRLQRACRLVLDASDRPSKPRGPAWWRRGAREDAGSVLHNAAQALLDRAVNLDSRLVTAARGTAGWRHRQLPLLAAEVASLEASAQRLASLSAAVSTQLAHIGLPTDPADPVLLLDAMEAAIEDLDGISAGGTPGPSRLSPDGIPGIPRRGVREQLRPFRHR